RRLIVTSLTSVPEIARSVMPQSTADGVAGDDAPNDSGGGIGFVRADSRYWPGGNPLIVNLPPPGPSLQDTPFCTLPGTPGCVTASCGRVASLPSGPTTTPSTRELGTYCMTKSTPVRSSPGRSVSGNALAGSATPG